MRATRLLTLLALAITAWGIAVTPGRALTKAPAVVPDHGGEDSWRTSQSLTIAYYNICTGWSWNWSGWEPGEQVGVVFDLPFGSCTLTTTWALTFSGVPAGWGFTGTIAIVEDADCPGAPLAQQPWKPPSASGWYGHDWGGLPVPDQFVVLITWAAPSGITNGSGHAFDHPSPGPSGPAACGTCYPTTRQSHTLHYGILGSLCPGVTLNDGVCDVEAVIEAAFACPTATEPATWGKLKALYR